MRQSTLDKIEHVKWACEDATVKAYKSKLKYGDENKIEANLSYNGIFYVSDVMQTMVPLTALVNFIRRYKEELGLVATHLSPDMAQYVFTNEVTLNRLFDEARSSHQFRQERRYRLENA